MAEHSTIEWTDATWNPITGCSVISPGCTNCYAMRLAGTRMKNHESRAGLTRESKSGPVWTGEVSFNEQWLDQPLRWKRPRYIFVCAHGDLFHHNVPDAWIDQIFAVMALAPQHIFQVLTKRAERMRSYMAMRRRKRRIAAAAADISDMLAAKYGRKARVPLAHFDRCFPPHDRSPFPNVWLGVSIEDQPRADERLPHLRETPAAIRFLSIEPLIGPVGQLDLDGIGWVIVGGESGPNARSTDPDWARSLRDQCQAAGVHFFMKQMTKKASIPIDLMIREFPDAR